ncbi:hypothetical protein GCM10009784_15820 [Arthrobacter parietis]|uniref:N-acetyltransferase domain-containing protein n=1 Tax=Arthrobacter parietis TaxID=271434 RepID=A0ABN3AUP8_9MICC
MQSWREAYAHLAPAQALAALDVVQRVSRWVDIIRDGGSEIWVAVIDSQTVGWITIGRGREGTPRSTELEGLYVLASHYGTGAGQRLVEAGLGAEPAYLWMAADNPRAHAFYRRNGFRPDGASATHAIVGTPVHIVRLVR